jgi:hypothetical protein
MSNSNRWLCRLSSRWEGNLDRRGLLELKVNPRVEDLKVYMALLALPLVEGLALAPSLQPTEGHNGQGKEFKAGRLDMLRQIILELDDLSDNEKPLS